MLGIVVILSVCGSCGSGMKHPTSANFFVFFVYVSAIFEEILVVIIIEIVDYFFSYNGFRDRMCIETFSTESLLNFGWLNFGWIFFILFVLVASADGIKIELWGGHCSALMTIGDFLLFIFFLLLRNMSDILWRFIVDWTCNTLLRCHCHYYIIIVILYYEQP